MTPSAPELLLAFDFDNTVTAGDMLDQLIQRYSPNEEWKTWEAAWAQGRLSARDCLKQQVANMRVSREALLRHAQTVQIDPWFAPICAWARARSIALIIVSDSFVPLIDTVLRAHGIGDVSVFANTLAFGEDDRLSPAFPFYDPACARSANDKSRHLAPYCDHTILFTGDGRSDLDAALNADIVFAKDTLATELRSRSVPFHSFETLETILRFLEAQYA